MDCRTCKFAYSENGMMYCEVDSDFMLDCEHAECPEYEEGIDEE
ncbi:hypothetical protein [Cetobacterium sp.]